MKFTAEQGSFADATAWVARMVSGRPTLPVFGGILLELTGSQLRLVATDLDHTGETAIQVRGADDGRVVVPGHLFRDVIRNLPEAAVEVEATDGDLRIRCGHVFHELRLLASDDFPARVEPSLDQAGELPGELLAEAAGQLAPVASRDESRPVLTGILLETNGGQLLLAATDSYRLALRELEWAWPHEPARVIVPARVLTEVAKAQATAERVTVAIEPHQITFLGGGRRLTSRLLEGEFPPFRKLIPHSNNNSATISRQALLDALKQVAPYGHNDNPVRLSFTHDHLKVTGQLTDVGQGATTVDAKYAGEPLTVAFNPAYLADGVGAVQDTEVVLELQAANKPSLLRGSDPQGFCYVLMPVRLPS